MSFMLLFFLYSQYGWRYLVLNLKQAKKKKEIFLGLEY